MNAEMYIKMQALHPVQTPNFSCAERNADDIIMSFKTISNLLIIINELTVLNNLLP